jgi:XTP/dITP diphosphohydrolase
MKILLATANKGKIKEISDLIRGLPLELLSFSDIVDYPEIQEDGNTFEENALKKARILAGSTGITTIADDSGLCVDALNGRPGVYSARYAGANSSDAEKIAKLLEELKGVPEERRTARFVCVIALVTAQGEERVFPGVCEGRISIEPLGSGGFGYDPVFFYPELNTTFGTLPLEQKNKVSHRARALALLIKHLKLKFF